MKAKKFLTSDYILNLLPESIYWLDENYTYQGSNESYLHFLKLNSASELIGKSNSHFKHFFTSDSIESIHKNNEKVLTTGKSQVFEEVVTLKNGDKKIFLSHKFPLHNEKGKVCGLLATLIDVTHHKDYEDDLKSQIAQKELTLENIIANMPGHVYWKDVEGVYLGCNHSQAKSLGLRYGDEVIGKTDFDLSKTPKEAMRFRENDKRIMESGIAETVEEIAQVDGKEATVISRKAPLKDKNGKVVGILGISIDISDRKKAEQELKIAKEVAELANQAKTEFLNNMRHDLRTPFTGILGMAQLLEEEETDPVKKESLADIAESAQALLNHLNEILEFVQLEGGQLPILEKPFDLYELLHHTFNILLPSAKNKQLHFTLTINEDVPHFLLGDAVRTQRILMNLISNAIKFTDKGNVKVGVQIEDKPEGKIVLAFTVEDTGIGIPDDKRDIIFERFNRLTSSYSGTYAGKGLGLKIVRQFLDEIGGQAYVTSELGKGTVFKILIPYQLPLLRQLTQEDKSKQLMVPTLTETSTTSLNHEVLSKKNETDKKNKKPLSKKTGFKTNKILIVEDHPIAAKIAKTILSEIGCEVDIAENGRVALEQVEKNPYDLIFMDIGLPDMDGYAVTKRIRSHRLKSITKIPIVALTAHAETEEKQRCLDAGINMVITKPITKKWAKSVLDSFIPKRQKQKRQISEVKKATKANTIPAEKIVDIEYAKTLLGGNETVVQEMLTMLVDSLPEELKALEAAYQQKNWQELRNLAHKLKGGASYCGTPRLKSACTELENAVKSGETAKIPDLYQRLLAEIKALKKFMADQSFTD